VRFPGVGFPRIQKKKGVSPATNLKNKPATATPKGGARRGW